MRRPGDRRRRGAHLCRISVRRRVGLLGQSREARALGLADVLGAAADRHQLVVIVPGNHDLSWTLSRKAYTPVRREDLPEGIEPESCIDQGGPYVEVRNDELFRQRFKPFSDFYAQVRSEQYPLEEDRQFTLHHLPAQRLLVLGLNSAWALDHFHRDRASIHTVALGHALRQVRTTLAYADSMRIAVWHHPIHSEGDDRIRDTGFLERLAKAGFRLALHGHVHMADNDQFRLDRSVAGRRLDIIAAGTFGARREDRVSGIPLQYQLLRFSGRQLVVETRRRERDNGAWKPDARWEQGPDLPPLPSYMIPL